MARTVEDVVLSIISSLTQITPLYCLVPRFQTFIYCLSHRHQYWNCASCYHTIFPVNITTIVLYLPVVLIPSCWVFAWLACLSWNKECQQCEIIRPKDPTFFLSCTTFMASYFWPCNLMAALFSFMLPDKSMHQTHFSQKLNAYLTPA